MKTTLRQIAPDFLEFWVWQPVIDQVNVYNDDGEKTGTIDDFTSYDFRGKWCIAMRTEGDLDSFFLPDIDFFRNLQEIGDCIAVGIPRPQLSDAPPPTKVEGEMIVTDVEASHDPFYGTKVSATLREIRRVGAERTIEIKAMEIVSSQMSDYDVLRHALHGQKIMKFQMEVEK